MIDEKGKLFGIINVIDLLALAVLLAVIGGAGFMLLGKGPTPINVISEQKDMYVTVLCRLVQPSTAQNLHKGDRLTAKNTYADGEIFDCVMTPGEFFTTTAEGQGSLITHPLYVDALVTLKGKGVETDPIIKIGGQEMRIGMKVYVKTQKVEIMGNVESIEFK